MKNDVTELVFILDSSGSMESLTDDTIGGFNSVLKEQSEKEGKVLVTTILFSNGSRMIHDRLPIKEVPAMTRNDYRASGCTALMDAIGDAIRHIVDIHRYARPEDVPGETLFVITTDGMENASHRYSSEQVRRMVKHEEEKYGWEFIFLAANIDAAETAERIGVDRAHAVDYFSDGRGTEVMYEAVNNAVSAKRERIRLDSDNSWRKNADEDFFNRKE